MIGCQKKEKRDAANLPARCVIRSNGAADNKELGLGWKSDTDSGLGGDEAGANVKGEALTLWDPVALDVDELLDALEKLGGVEGRQANAQSTAAHALHVHHRAEQPDLGIFATVSLHSLKALNCVMENRGGGIHLKWPAGHDVWCLPALGSGPIDVQHVVTEHTPKCQCFLGWVWQRSGGLLNGSKLMLNDDENLIIIIKR